MRNHIISLMTIVERKATSIYQTLVQEWQLGLSLHGFLGQPWMKDFCACSDHILIFRGSGMLRVGAPCGNIGYCFWTVVGGMIRGLS